MRVQVLSGEVAVEVSFFEVQNEQLRDILRRDPMNTGNIKVCATERPQLAGELVQTEFDFIRIAVSFCKFWDLSSVSQSLSSLGSGQASDARRDQG